ncbi:MAG: HlyD family type I secretion periplasmic adaptor subunit [Burkholderiales bacterium]|nr:HlyD family type I secretion periplasmic adaptor subunit [Burkholderiales bacterium]
MTDNTASPMRHPLRELLSRYKTVFQHAWAHRAELAGPERHTTELAFLPAALSLQDTPVHPAPRRLAWGLMILFVLALLWACLGHVDIVAVAPGRIIVSDRTKVIQPLEASVVKAVRVKDGDRVKAGQVLVELDPTMATADSASVQEQLKTQASEALRTFELLQMLSKQKLPALVPRAQMANLTQDSAAQHQAQLQSEWQDIQAKLAKLDAEAARRQTEIATVQQTIAKLEATVPMAQTREADFKRLVGEGFISSHATQDKTRERVELERDLTVQRARLAEAQSALNETQQTKAAYKSETLRTLSDRHAQASTKYSQLQLEATKATQRERQTQLTAPVDGIIQQLAIHTTGGVVTSAQPLMIVVPDSPTVTAEITIANQDIGFVNAGQMAEVKLETFPYTQYGTVQARVDVVTADAVTDEKRGSYYPATLTLSQKDMLIDGKRVNLSPGMNITAEIKTGQRRIIEFLLSPVQRAGSESLRER